MFLILLENSKIFNEIGKNCEYYLHKSIGGFMLFWPDKDKNLTICGYLDVLRLNIA